LSPEPLYDRGHPFENVFFWGKKSGKAPNGEKKKGLKNSEGKNLEHRELKTRARGFL